MGVAAHDGDVQTAGLLGILHVFDLDVLQELHDAQMAVVHRVVQTVEALRVDFIELIAHGALQQNFDDVRTTV